jgi:hypothetical protein
MSEPRPIPAEAVRVWRGFRSPSMNLDDFFQRLGTVFVPATVEMQIQIGLDAYIPTVPAALPGKPDTVPDETAILFWDSQQTYTDGFKTLAVRTYTLTHAAVYTPQSGANFPNEWSGELASGQPYHLSNEPADWMPGPVTHVIGSRPQAQSPEDFRAALAEVSAGIASAGVQGAIVCAADDYVVYWVLGDDHGGAARIAGCCDWSHVAEPEPTSLPAGLWDDWPGLTIGSGASLNMQFERRWQ